MEGRYDPEGMETQTLHDLVDFAGKDVLEIGCGDGRMTWRFADVANSVLALDPDEPSIVSAREQTPCALMGKLSFRVADVATVSLTEGPPCSTPRWRVTGLSPSAQAHTN